MTFRRLQFLVLLPALLIVSSLSSGATVPAGDWLSLAPAKGGVRAAGGFRGTVNALVVDAAGNLFVGGFFTSAGSVPANNVAMWDGNRWNALDTGVAGSVSALAIDAAGHLIVGGGFPTAGGIAVNNIAKWDGSSWASLGTGTNGGVSALQVSFTGYLYVGGSFTTAGDQPASRVARWNGVSWSSLGSGMNDTVSSLAEDPTGSIYAGGSFTLAGGMTANRVAKWNPQVGVESWSPLGSGITGNGVNALATDSLGNLYVGGSFLSAGGLAGLSNLAMWNGTNWNPAFPGTNTAVSTLAVNADNHLYAGGSFSTAGGTVAKRVARWNGASWSALGSGIANVGAELPWAMATGPDGQVYVGGTFNEIGGVQVNALAQWNNSSWSTVGAGPDARVEALAFDSADNVYLAGLFSEINDGPAEHIARWNGSEWTPLGAGLNGIVHALAMDSNDLLYAAGQFTSAGGVPALNIAKWDGTTWTEVGGGLGGTVRTLALDDNDNLYAGGAFLSAGGTPGYSRIAKWNGVAWEQLGVGTDNPVHALALSSDGTVYAAGDFTMAGGQPARHVAAWNEGAWSPLGNGSNSPIPALAIDSRGDLYSPFGRWDGETWHALPELLDGSSGIRTITADAFGNVYFAGNALRFSAAPAEWVRVAKWNGLRWSDASQISDPSYLIHALAFGPDHSLWVGGEHLITQRNWGNVAWTPSPLLLTPCGGERWQTETTRQIVWNTAAPAIKLEYSTDNGTTWILLEATLPGTPALYNWTIPNIPSNTTLVRITELGGLDRVATSQPFELASLKLTNLELDAVWRKGEPQTITWNSSFIEEVDLQYSTDNGITWTNIATALPASQGSFQWTPGITAGGARIRILDTLGSGVQDLAAGIITIKSLELTVLDEPLTFLPGSPFTISWLQEWINLVDIAYSKDGGTTWLPIATGAPARIPPPGPKTVGTYDWEIPFDPGMNYRLRVSDSEHPEIAVEGVAPFTIELPQLTLIDAPSSLVAGEVYAIRWSGEWSSELLIEYAMDGDPEWRTIADGVPAEAGSFDWTVPFKLGSGFRIRITDTLHSTITDQSSIPFSIVLPTRFARLQKVGFFPQAPLPYLNVLFHAVDQDNVGIDNLQAAELRISENGSVVSEAERIVLLKNRDQLDYTMKTVLLLDNSTSITAEEKPKVLDAARAFINNKLPGQEIAIYFFSGITVQLQDFTTDPNLLLAAITNLSTIPRIPSTDLWGAVRTGLDQWTDNYSLNGAQRGVVTEGTLVVLSDGDHNTTPEPISTVLNHRGSKRIVTVSFGHPDTINTDVLTQLENGGYYPGQNADDLEDLFVQIQEDLIKFANSFYWLGYATPKRGRFANTLEVALETNINTDPDAVIVEDFSSADFTGLIIPNIVVNPTPLNPFGVNSITIPSLGSEVVNLVTTFTFAAEPYEFEIADPDLLTIRPTATLFEYEFEGSAFDGASTTVTIRDPVNGYETTITINFSGASPFALWADALGLSGPMAAPSATPFGDTLPNLLRFGMGIGAVPGPDELPVNRIDRSPDGDLFVLAYQKSKAASEVQIVPQFWSEENGWIDVPETNVVQVADRDANTESWELRFPLPDAATRLVRLEARIGN